MHRLTEALFYALLFIWSLASLTFILLSFWPLRLGGLCFGGDETMEDIIKDWATLRARLGSFFE